MADESPTLGSIAIRNGLAGQVSYTVAVRYDREVASDVTFVGNVLGGPVVMITIACPKGVIVTDPGRFGKFSAQWLRRSLRVDPL
jgi:hypothetical protein